MSEENETYFDPKPYDPAEAKIITINPRDYIEDGCFIVAKTEPEDQSVVIHIGGSVAYTVQAMSEIITTLASGMDVSQQTVISRIIKYTATKEAGKAVQKFLEDTGAPEEILEGLQKRTSRILYEIALGGMDEEEAPNLADLMSEGGDDRASRELDAMRLFGGMSD